MDFYLLFGTQKKFNQKKKILDLNLKIAEDFITYGIIILVLGGRIGYIFFYNFEYYLINPVEIIKIWKGGMSFHGALIGLVIHMIVFAYKKTKYCRASKFIGFLQSSRNFFWENCKFYKWRINW